jgi:hypothetical protein
MILLALITGFLVLSSLPSGGNAVWCLGLAMNLALAWGRAVRLSIPRALMHLLLFPFLLFALNLHGIYDHALADFFKDFWYFTLPLVYLSVGYLCFERVGSWQRLMQPMILAGVGTGGYVLVHAVFNRGDLAAAATVDAYRAVTGGGTFVPMAPLMLVLVARRAGLPARGLERWKLVRVLVYVTGAGATLITLSRTHMVTLAGGILCTLHFRRALRKLVFSGGTGLVVLLLGVGGAVYLTTQAKAGPLDLFAQKVMNSGSEVQVRAYETFEQINNNWRGYEAYRASLTYAKFSLPEKIFGGGGGSLVDLGFAMQLSPTEFFKYVPYTHNGYMYILVKDGACGLCLFALFLLQMLWMARQAFRMRDPEATVAGLLLLWTPFVMAATQGVITGIYNKGELVPVLFLAGAAAASYARRREALQEVQARNFRLRLSPRANGYGPGAGRAVEAL